MWGSECVCDAHVVGSFESENNKEVNFSNAHRLDEKSFGSHERLLLWCLLGLHLILKPFRQIFVFSRLFSIAFGVQSARDHDGRSQWKPTKQWIQNQTKKNARNARRGFANWNCFFKINLKPTTGKWRKNGEKVQRWNEKRQGKRSRRRLQMKYRTASVGRNEWKKWAHFVWTNRRKQRRRSRCRPQTTTGDRKISRWRWKEFRKARQTRRRRRRRVGKDFETSFGNEGEAKWVGGWMPWVQAVEKRAFQSRKKAISWLNGFTRTKKKRWEEGGVKEKAKKQERKVNRCQVVFSRRSAKHFQLGCAFRAIWTRLERKENVLCIHPLSLPPRQDNGIWLWWTTVHTSRSVS